VGSITYPADAAIPLPTGESLIIKRVEPLTQETDLQNQGGYFPQVQEDVYDKLTMIDLQQQELLDRSFRFPIAYTGGIDIETGTPAADGYLKVNAAGTGLEWSAVASTTASAASATPIADAITGAVGVGTDYARDDHVHPQTHIIGGAIASASPLVVDTDGRYFHVTGTTGFAAMTVAADRLFVLHFDGALTMTHHATNLDLPGEADILTKAGDIGLFQSTGANTVQCIAYTRAATFDYESAETALNNDAQITFAHGLGQVPNHVQVILRANTATAQGWADNEETEFSFPYQGALADDGVDVTWDATNVYITQGANIQLLDHTTFNHETITQTEYDWVVRAWM
jgi:hypothetical protein